MAYTIPNEADAFNANQAEPDKVDIDILVAGHEGTGVINGCAVTAQGDFAGRHGEGHVGAALRGRPIAVTAGNVTITTAHATNPRFDLVVVDSAGTKSVTAGTAAAEPVFPSVPADSVCLAAVYVPANDTAIASNQVTDKRVVLPQRQPTAFIGARVYNSTTQNVNDDTLTDITFDSEEFDTDGFHSTSVDTDRFTIPAGLGGKYIIVGGTFFATADADGVRIVRLRKNGADVRGEMRHIANATSSGTTIGTWILDLVAGDFLELVAYQNSGAAMNIGHATELEDQSHFSITKLDSGKLGSGIGVVVRHSTSQTITTDPQALVWDTEDLDTDGFHSTSSNTSRLTVPAGLGGLYAISVTAEYSLGGGTARLRIRKNGDTSAAGILSFIDVPLFIATTGCVAYLVAGDYVEAVSSAVSSGSYINTDVTQRFAMFRIDSGTSAYTGPRWGSGTAFPSGPSTNDRFTRTDRGLDYYYDGTRWLTTTLYTSVVGQWQAVTVTTGWDAAPLGAVQGDYDIYIVKFYAQMYTVSGLSGSAFWTVKLLPYDAGTPGSNIASVSNVSGTNAQYARKDATVNALLAASTDGLYAEATKTSTPGAFSGSALITYRLVG